MEALQLRVKDLDFGYQSIHVHNAKGAKDRMVTFPKILHPAVHLQLVPGRRLRSIAQHELPHELDKAFGVLRAPVFAL